MSQLLPLILNINYCVTSYLSKFPVIVFLYLSNSFNLNYNIYCMGLVLALIIISLFLPFFNLFWKYTSTINVIVVCVCLSICLCLFCLPMSVSISVSLSVSLPLKNPSSFNPFKNLFFQTLRPHGYEGDFVNEFNVSWCFWAISSLILSLSLFSIFFTFRTSFITTHKSFSPWHSGFSFLISLSGSSNATDAYNDLPAFDAHFYLFSE